MATYLQIRWAPLSINMNKGWNEAETMRIESIKDLEAISQEYRKKLYYPEAIKVNVGMASCGIAAGAQKTLEKAMADLPDGPGLD